LVAAAAAGIAWALAPDLRWQTVTMVAGLYCVAGWYDGRR